MHIFIQSTKKEMLQRYKQLYHSTISSCKKGPPKNYSKVHESHIEYEIPMKQAGLEKGGGAREQIGSVSESWEAHGSTTQKCQCVL